MKAFGSSLIIITIILIFQENHSPSLKSSKTDLTLQTTKNDYLSFRRYRNF